MILLPLLISITTSAPAFFWAPDEATGAAIARTTGRPLMCVYAPRDSRSSGQMIATLEDRDLLKSAAGFVGVVVSSAAPNTVLNMPVIEFRATDGHATIRVGGFQWPSSVIDSMDRARRSFLAEASLSQVRRAISRAWQGDVDGSRKMLDAAGTSVAESDRGEWALACAETAFVKGEFERACDLFETAQRLCSEPRSVRRAEIKRASALLRCMRGGEAARQLWSVLEHDDIDDAQREYVMRVLGRLGYGLPFRSGSFWQ